MNALESAVEWSSTTKSWLPMSSPVYDSTIRLFCFPHAGGSASAYRSWQSAFGSAVQVCPLEYPGRWSRHREPAMKDLRKLVQAVVDGVGDLFSGRFAFFGYSFGGLVAFEVAQALRRLGRVTPEHLFVGAVQAPSTLYKREQIHALPTSKFLESIDHRYGVLPAVVRRDPDLLNMVLPVLRADLTALESYAFERESPLPCAITAFAGRDDAMTDHDDVAAWQELTHAEFALHELPGGHFFIQTNESAIVKLVGDSLREPAK